MKLGQFQNDDEYIWRGVLLLAPGSAPRWRVRNDSGQAGDRAMQIEIRAPRALWDLPTMRATVVIGESDAPDVEIDAEAAADALRPILGAEVRVTVHRDEDG